MPADAAVLAPLAANAARERLRITLPTLLDVPSPGATTEERATALRRGWEELRQAGWATGDELDPFLAQALRTLHRPAVQLTVVAAEAGGSSIRAVAAAGPESAVLATAAHGGLAVRAVPRSGLARVAVDLLPDVPAGPGQSVSLPAEALAAANGATANGAPVAGVRAEDARLLTSVLGGERRRAGQFGARGFDPLSGRTTWSPMTVDVLDTAAGRYFAQHRRGPDGRKWFTLAPTDRRRLLDRVEDLLRHVQPGEPV